MNMKRLLTLVAFFATVHASAQQVNPVPDYVFANRMSAGRNTVTDTAAYFSIGPRYGATRGMMPPMVVDTASFSGNRRNGLLIFSVQKNKFLYWDSVRVQWSDMAGSSGSYITGTLTNNYIPKATSSTTLGNSVLYDDGTNIGLGRVPTYKLDIAGTARIDTTVYLGKGNIDNQSLIKLPGSYELLYKQNVSTFDGFILDSSFGNHFFFRATEGRQHQSFYIGDAQTTQNAFGFATFDSTDNFWRARIAINQNGNTGINTNAPAYDLDVNGTLRTVNGAIFASTIGEILMGTTSDAGDYRLQVSGKIYNTGDAVLGLNSGSNVTIGTVTPAYNATGRGNLTINGLDAILSFKVSDANAGYIYHNATNLLMNNALNGGIIFLTNNGENARINAAGELILSTTGSDLGNYRLQVTGNIISDGHITTGGPTGGSAKTWKLGEAASVTPTSPNRTIRVEIDGTVYYLHAKTTND